MIEIPIDNVQHKFISSFTTTRRFHIRTNREDKRKKEEGKYNHPKCIRFMSIGLHSPFPFFPSLSKTTYNIYQIIAL